MIDINRLTGTLISAAVVAASGFALYRILLTDDARMSLRSTIKSVKSTYTQISDALIDRRGVIMSDGDFPNQVATREQWEALGY